jgi:hypothetical protein
VTEPANAAAVLVPAELGDAELAAEEAALEAAVLAAEVELELVPELHAAAPATRQAPTAATCHLEPTLFRRDIPVKRAMAPCRLSAVNSPVSGLSSARRGAARAYRID